MPFHACALKDAALLLRHTGEMDARDWEGVVTALRIVGKSWTRMDIFYCLRKMRLSQVDILLPGESIVVGVVRSINSS